jgi:toxin ParE1/3/4
MTPYTIAPLARNDLDEVWSYIACDSVAAAERMIDVLYQKFLLLASQPFIGEERPELAPHVPSFSVGNYAVLYRPMKNAIEVARVIHAARDINAQF